MYELMITDGGDLEKFGTNAFIFKETNIDGLMEIIKFFKEHKLKGECEFFIREVKAE